MIFQHIWKMKLHEKNSPNEKGWRTMTYTHIHENKSHPLPFLPPSYLHLYELIVLDEGCSKYL